MAVEDTQVAEPLETATEPSEYDFDDPMFDRESADTESEETNETAEAPEGVEETPPEDTGEVADEAVPDIPFSDELLIRAGELGFTAGEVSRFGSPEALQTALDASERAILQMLGSKKEPEPEQAAETVETFEFNREKLLEKFDEEYVDFLESNERRHFESRQALRKELADLHTQLGELKQHTESSQREIQERQAEEQQSRFDAFIDGLGEEYRDLLGSGPSKKMPPTSAEFRNRVEVWERMQALRAWHMQRGHAPEADKLYREALHAAFGDQFQTIARKQIETTSATRRKSAIARPAGREGTVDPTTKAAQRIEKFWAEHGKVTEPVGEL
jgi:hypothetical protein